MNVLDIIKTEIQLVKHQTDKLIEKIETSQWNLTPEVLKTNMNWQIGHIILANYFFGITSISRSNQRLTLAFDIEHLTRLYGLQSIPSADMSGKPSTTELKQMYDLVFQVILESLGKMDEEDLGKPTEVPNPGAKTKYESLAFMSRHQSWHNGQIAMLSRILNSPSVG